METDMRVPRLALAAVAAAGALALSGCADDIYGPYGYGYGGYGYGSPYSGYGYGYPYASYGYGNAYGGYGYYGGYDPFGWYSDSYYPGGGIYLYDSGRNRHVRHRHPQAQRATRPADWQNRAGTA